MKPAGYLINNKDDAQGEHGFIYDYILAENGLFLEARSPLIEARVSIAPVAVRGLNPLDEILLLSKGKIPGHLYELAMAMLYMDIYRECYLAFTWDGEYRIRKPEQVQHELKVEYQVLPSTIMDIHSHGSLPALNSQLDNQDEQGFRLSLVAGKLNTATPELNLRLAVYGYYMSLELKDVFECIP